MTANRKRTVVTKADIAAHNNRGVKSKHGHAFAPDPIPPGFHTVIDASTHPLQPWRDLPPATGISPYHMDLSSVLEASAIKAIKDSGVMVFHSVGDTGGVNTPTYLEGVVRFMECDFTLAKSPNIPPCFFYHLGDVVYYDGESANYWPEFYEPYLNYPAPIVAIPGNHDGDVNAATGESSLQAFVRNFCAQSAVISPDNREAPRRTMTQPNVFWTLTTPLVTIIGLYSNCPEGGQIGESQRLWFISELKSADKKLPIILAVHHPIYSAYGAHPGSTKLKQFLDDCCAQAARAPDLVLTGHVHDYQRFSAPLGDKKSVPFIVAGAGGYNKRLHVLGKPFQTALAGKKLPVQLDGDADTLLENFNDSQHGYLRVTVRKAGTKYSIVLDYVTVPDPSQTSADAYLKPYDSVTVNFP